MKMIYCTCNVSVIEGLQELLDKCHVQDYQIIDQVIARNEKGEPRFNTPIWPGYNSIALMQVSEEEKVRRVIMAIREYNRSVVTDDELITVCTWNLEECLFDASAVLLG